jgi:excisionase family DNA binding protein
MQLIHGGTAMQNGGTSMQNQVWLPMKEAAKRLGISYYKLIRMVDRGKIQTMPDDLDRRVRLVNLEEVKKVFRIN